jgi:hypothetical protein
MYHNHQLLGKCLQIYLIKTIAIKNDEYYSYNYKLFFKYNFIFFYLFDSKNFKM